MRNEDGTFGSGNSGRKKGSSNKNTSQVRDAYTKLLQDNLEQLKDDFKELDPKDRIKLFLDMSKYIIPQLKATELDIGDKTLDKFNKPLAEFFGIDTKQ